MSFSQMNNNLFQLLYYAFRLGFPGCKVSAGWPLAQAIHESAGFTSAVYKRTNNLLGMKAPQTRQTTAKNKGGEGYAQYSSPAQSIKDYLYWLDVRGIHTDEQLLALLKKPASAGGYAGDPAYVQRVLATYKSLAGQLVDPAKLGAVVLVLFLTAAGLVAFNSQS